MIERIVTTTLTSITNADTRNLNILVSAHEAVGVKCAALPVDGDASAVGLLNRIGTTPEEADE